MPPVPIPTTIIKTTASASRFGVWAIFQFIWKHLYVISIIFFLLPTVIGSIKIAKQTNNPAYPFLETGLTVINADAELDKDVNILRKNSIELTGTKPELGLWNKTKYYWNLILLYWKIIGLVFLISVPFKLIYTFSKHKGELGYETSTWQNLKKTLIIGFIFIFFVNLVLVIVGSIDGTLTLLFPQDSNFYQKSWIVIRQTTPLHGMWNLATYLYSQSI